MQVYLQHTSKTEILVYHLVIMTFPTQAGILRLLLGSLVLNNYK